MFAARGKRENQQTADNLDFKWLQILVRGGGKWCAKSRGNWSVTVESAEGGEVRGRQQAGETSRGAEQQKMERRKCAGEGGNCEPHKLYLDEENGTSGNGIICRGDPAGSGNPGKL